MNETEKKKLHTVKNNTKKWTKYATNEVKGYELFLLMLFAFFSKFFLYRIDRKWSEIHCQIVFEYYFIRRFNSFSVKQTLSWGPAKFRFFLNNFQLFFFYNSPFPPLRFFKRNEWSTLIKLNFSFTRFPFSMRFFSLFSCYYCCLQFHLDVDSKQSFNIFFSLHSLAFILGFSHVNYLPCSKRSALEG